MKTKAELLTEARNANTACEDILKKVQAEGRGLDAMDETEKAQYDTANTEYCEAKSQIQLLAKVEEHKSITSQWAAGGHETTDAEGLPVEVRESAKAIITEFTQEQEYRFWGNFQKFARAGGQNADWNQVVSWGRETRDAAKMLSAQVRSDTPGLLTIGQVDAAGITVPILTANSINDLLYDVDPVLQLAERRNDMTGANFRYLIQSSFADPGFTGEIEQFTPASPTVRYITLGSYDLTAEVLISEDLQQDSLVAIQDWTQNGIVERYAFKTGYFTLRGSGSNQPTGIIGNVRTGVTTAATDAVTFEEIQDFMRSVIPAYRNNPIAKSQGKTAFLFNDTTIGELRKLKSSFGIPLWLPFGAADEDTLLGYPVLQAPSLDDLGAGNTFGVFGNFLKGYVVRTSKQLTMRPLFEKYADTGEIAVIAKSRWDAAPTITEALSCIVNHA